MLINVSPSSAFCTLLFLFATHTCLFAYPALPCSFSFANFGSCRIPLEITARLHFHSLIRLDSRSSTTTTNPIQRIRGDGYEKAVRFLSILCQMQDSQRDTIYILMLATRYIPPPVTTRSISDSPPLASPPLESFPFLRSPRQSPDACPPFAPVSLAPIIVG